MLLSVNSEKQSYDVIVQNGAIHDISRWVDLNRKVMIITDDGVPSDYSKQISIHCKEPVFYIIKQGESSKNINNFGKILSEMIRTGFTRTDCLVAVGGGVVSDLGGFVASCYMRGIDFYSVPTTLLAQIDASIGGKTAIDFEGIKNAVGSFYQPKKVIIDPNTLKTLDKRQLNAGLAEAIKVAATCDAELFNLIENSRDMRDDLPEIIRRSVHIKKTVVENDPKENGLRRVLNFGHTIGHSIESFYKGDYLHGECVAAGMIPMCSDEVRERLIRVLKKNNLPTYFSGKIQQLMPAILLDKKRQKGFVQTVFVDEIGKFKFVNMSPKEISERMEKTYTGQLWENRKK